MWHTQLRCGVYLPTPITMTNLEMSKFSDFRMMHLLLFYRRTDNQPSRFGGKPDLGSLFPASRSLALEVFPVWKPKQNPLEYTASLDPQLERAWQGRLSPAEVEPAKHDTTEHSMVKAFYSLKPNPLNSCCFSRTPYAQTTRRYQSRFGAVGLGFAARVLLYPAREQGHASMFRFL